VLLCLQAHNGLGYLAARTAPLVDKQPGVLSSSKEQQLMYTWCCLLLCLQAHNGLGKLAGRTAPPVDKLFGVLTSLGNVAFAYNSCVVMIEIQVSHAAAAGVRRPLML
jgi:hypothetical protein